MLRPLAPRRPAAPGGFTLVEAAVALAVVAILAGLITPVVQGVLERARVARARNDLQIIAGAIAAQLKDTGTRPRWANGPGGADAIMQEVWYSAGMAPAVGAMPPNDARIPSPLGVGGPNTFTNLLTAPNPARGISQADADHLFRSPLDPPGTPARYSGPYLSPGFAEQSDPWGRAYLILGYNNYGAASQGPIWVVSAGPLGTINPMNLVATGLAYPKVWNPTNGSEGNLAVRVQ